MPCESYWELRPRPPQYERNSYSAYIDMDLLNLSAAQGNCEYCSLLVSSLRAIHHGSHRPDICSLFWRLGVKCYMT